MSKNLKKKYENDISIESICKWIEIIKENSIEIMKLKN